jgi:hypothetical protein
MKKEQPIGVLLCVAGLGFTLFVYSSFAVASDRTGDEFLAGYIASILERELNWERAGYSISMADGVATITVFQDDPIRRAAAMDHLHTIDGLQGISIVVRPAEVGSTTATSQFLGIIGEGDAFPMGDLFRPLIADPKTPQFFISINGFSSLDERFTRASVGFGETFGIFRFFGDRVGDGLQLSLQGALFAQFNMDSPSYDLINADYTFGIPVTYRHGGNSLRLRIYHQSSHLGDELLLRANHPERVNLSYESVELIYSYEWHGWRAYGGGEQLFHKEPDDLKPLGAHLGIEYRFSKTLLWNGRPLGGVDMKSLEENDWEIDTSVKIGLEFGHPNPGHRRIRLMAEWYQGFDPHGQFYSNKVEYYGLGVSLGF